MTDAAAKPPRRHRHILLSIAVCAALFTALLLFVIPRRPLRGLRAEDVARITICLMPPNAAYTLAERADVEKAVALLRDIAVWNRASPEPMAGQSVEYRVEKTDGSFITVQPSDGFLTLDGICYSALCAPSDALCRFANEQLPV